MLMGEGGITIYKMISQNMYAMPYKGPLKYKACQ